MRVNGRKLGHLQCALEGAIATQLLLLSPLDSWRPQDECPLHHVFLAMMLWPTRAREQMEQLAVVWNCRIHEQRRKFPLPQSLLLDILSQWQKENTIGHTGTCFGGPIKQLDNDILKRRFSSPQNINVSWRKTQVVLNSLAECSA